MFILDAKSLLKFIALTLVGAILHACQQDEGLGEVLIYENDFSQENLKNIRNGRLREFNDKMVLGNYNNEEIMLTLNDLPAHKSLKVDIELLLHDSWDGNADIISGPDIWYFNLDNQTALHATFSNQPCVSTYCLSQSYPEAYGRHTDPRTGADEVELPGLCKYADSLGWTSRYSISKIIRHKGGSAILVCGDQTVQNYLETSQRCDESWSISRISISIVE
ncbi:hypothetical protein IFO69_19195 [Echinicola sp. CAU 1574]|uniref:Uncharacterized protein n=1 Tax=Echinicola arenosa TaxID=2774144 RepID=A0ABR9AQ32_9BACT|nr:hypothetical protein [Echinicola arenosa]MBD8490887.1 hypothetical protein [Echinicola arenosa]